MNYAGHHVIATTTPDTGAFSPLAVGYLWSDTSDNSVKVCTSISPVTFSAISGGGGAADNVVAARVVLGT